MIQFQNSKMVVGVWDFFRSNRKVKRKCVRLLLKVAPFSVSLRKERPFPAIEKPTRSEWVFLLCSKSIERIMVFDFRRNRINPVSSYAFLHTFILAS